MNSSFKAHVSTEQETLELAARFAQQLTGKSAHPLVIYLSGDLGAGKSVFVRALLQSLGVCGAIKSPTYTLVEQYSLSRAEKGLTSAAHLDLYRVVDPEELYFIDFDEIVLSCDLLLVEWPDKGGEQLPKPTYTVMIDYPADAQSGSRDISIIDHGN